MVLYFVCKLKLVSRKPGKEKLDKNKISILCYSNDDTEGWQKVKEQAVEYMKRKNLKLCDQTSGGSNSNEKQSVNEVYVIRESKVSDDKVNTIEVYKQWKEKIKGYVVTSYKDRELKVAEFSLSKFDNPVLSSCLEVQATIPGAPVPPPKFDIKAIANVIQSLDPKMLKELKECDLFKERIRQVDKYSRHDDMDDSE